MTRNANDETGGELFNHRGHREHRGNAGELSTDFADYADAVFFNLRNLRNLWITSVLVVFSVSSVVSVVNFFPDGERRMTNQIRMTRNANDETRARRRWVARHCFGHWAFEHSDLIRRSSLVIGHWSLVIGHWSLVIGSGCSAPPAGRRRAREVGTPDGAGGEGRGPDGRVRR